MTFVAWRSGTIACAEGPRQDLMDVAKPGGGFTEFPEKTNKPDHDLGPVSP